ncbi:ribbon-helix-helix domain-containing protein [Flagellimonas flava]|uniref:ribbon-helix-helix domain-containing protein n=1 Tax=Flagellimonas flava TaxID=570519 RepID=UPI003D64C9CC
MPRQSISLTRPNDDWLKSQVDSEEYASKSEVVNDLIRRARENQKEIAYIRAKLERAEQDMAMNGPVTLTPEEILEEAKKRLRNDPL